MASNSEEILLYLFEEELSPLFEEDFDVDDTFNPVLNSPSFRPDENLVVPLGLEYLNLTPQMAIVENSLAMSIMKFLNKIDFEDRAELIG